MSFLARKQQNTKIADRRRTDRTRQPGVQATNEDQYNFRRNRTLTGSYSSKVLSANENGGVTLKSSRVQAHELRHARRHLGLALGGVVVLIAGTLYLIAHFIATPTVTIEGVASRSEDRARYISQINTYLGQRPAERSTLVLDRANLLSYVQQDSPEIAAITDISSNLMGEVAFSLKPRAPIASWTIDNRRQYVDTHGVGFTRNYMGEPEVTIVDESGLPSNGKTVASNRFLGFIGRVVGETKRKGYTVAKVSLPHNTTRQIEVTLKEVDYPTKLTVDRSAGEQVEDMIRVAKYVNAHDLSLSYVDVRISGRAYYREK